MKFLTVVFWVMNADGGNFIPAKRLYRPPDFTGISQKTIDGRNGVLISLLFYII